MRNRLDLVGQRFGRLLVVASAGIPLRRRVPAWLCRCDCGEERITFGDNLTSGATRSCGCILRKHGLAGSHTYNSWKSMHDRCSNPNQKHWKNYGGRGIKVCAQWSGPGGFQQFLLDMGKRPTIKNARGRLVHSLDRYPNNDGNYEPGNCRWATWEQQLQNRRRGARTELA